MNKNIVQLTFIISLLFNLNNLSLTSNLLFHPQYSNYHLPSSFLDRQNNIKYPHQFWNVSLDIEQRLDDLMDLLTLQEMVDQMANGGGIPDNRPAPAIPRLNIPAYNFDTECLRGIVTLNSTAFPQSIGLAASFNDHLLYDVASVIGTEARAFYNDAMKRGDYSDMRGTSCLAPFINLVHHPLWGRIQEVYGEDPFLIGHLTTAYVKGMQGSDNRYVKANAGCKVILVHSGPENYPTSRMTFDAKVTERDMQLSYLPHFKKCIEAGSLNLMCSYNSINGVPACANDWLMNGLVRGEYGFKGYIISDMGAIENIYTGHKYVSSMLGAAAAAANAGVDLELNGGYSAYSLLKEAVEKGLVEWSVIYNRTRTLFYARMKLGHFDPVDRNPYNGIGMDKVQSPYHRSLALTAAQESFVLLKNKAGRLPISLKKLGRVAIIGPMADNLGQLFGGYSPAIQPQFSSTPYSGLKKILTDLHYTPGCSDSNHCTQYDGVSVKNASSEADLVVVCLGTGQMIEQEDNDRHSLDLPGFQLQLVLDAAKYSKMPIVLLLFTGGPVDLTKLVNASQIGAIIQCFLPAQATGEALRNVLFFSDDDVTEKVISPAGRLPYTWPESLDQVPPITNYSMSDRTYRYSQHIPLYPFGYGLSYSLFRYSGMVVKPCAVEIQSRDPGDGKIMVEVQLTNVGLYDSDEVTQVYVKWRKSPVPMPRIQMVAVKRHKTLSGSTKRVKLEFKLEELKVWHDRQGFIFYPGVIDIYVGGQQPDQMINVGSNILQSTLTIETI